MIRSHRSIGSIACQNFLSASTSAPNPSASLIVDVRRRPASPGRPLDAYAHGVIDETLPTGGETPPPTTRCNIRRTGSTASADRLPGRACKWRPHPPERSRRHRRRFHQLHDAADAARWHAALPHSINSAQSPLAWPKLWKHHGAKAETDRINQVARERKRTMARPLRRRDRPRMVLPQGAGNAEPCARRSTRPPRSGSKPATGSSGN